MTQNWGRENELESKNGANRLLKATALTLAVPFLIRHAVAMGNRQYTQGFRKLEGAVFLNDKPAQLGMLIMPGDKISTGENSLVVFVVEHDAYLLRSNSQLEISMPNAGITSLRLLAGKMLSVFAKGSKKIVLPTASIGIRGTGVYVEADPVRSYLCTCYGTVEIQANSNPKVQETVVTKRHDAPRYIYASGEQLIVKAPVINHTNDELFMLEALVGRMPAFYSATYEKGSGY
jgi:hypothetical protein